MKGRAGILLTFVALTGVLVVPMRFSGWATLHHGYVREIGPGGVTVYGDGLHLRPAGEAAVPFHFDRLTPDAKHFVSPSGRFLTLGHVDGTVVVYDLAEVGRRLAEFADR